MTLTVERAKLRDVYEIAQLCRKYPKELGFVPLVTLKDSQQHGELCVAIETPHQTHRAVLGFIKFHLRRDGQITLYSIAVRPNHTNKGIGKALITYLKQHLKNVKGTKIKLKAPANISANVFYTRCGFSHKGTDKGRKTPLNIWEWKLPTKGCYNE